MTRLLVPLLFVAWPAQAIELSVEGGPASVAGLEVGQGAFVRAAVAASAGGLQQVQLGLQCLAWRDADGSLPSRTSVSMRWQRTFASETSATPMVLVGLDFGLLGRQGPDGFATDGLALSGHFGAGIRVALSERLFAPMLMLATIGGGPPSIAAVVGLGASFE